MWAGESLSVLVVFTQVVEDRLRLSVTGENGMVSPNWDVWCQGHDIPQIMVYPALASLRCVCMS